MSHELGDKADIARCLAGLGGVIQQGLPERGARLFGAADVLFDASSLVVDPLNRADHDRNLAAARAQLGDDAFAAAWEAGRALTLEQALAEALDQCEHRFRCFLVGAKHLLVSCGLHRR